ncbi:MAG: TFIIB-type zinc ribbon-containing protein [Candidatus Zipacnadales bacterium]
MRICPHCTKVLQAIVIDGVTVEGCEGCGGAWFDKGELDDLAKRDYEALRRLDQAFQPKRADRPTPYHSLRCPVCLDRLEAFEFRHFPGIQMDGCKRCRGIWADNGELTKIAERIAKLKPRP